MADEELGRTVVCEALEYLTRLASNLGAKTVSMKEKRVNRGKLKDLRSVKEAADRVLLLCQLSKKSLENVEKSVSELLHGGGKTSGDGGNTAEVSHTSASKKARSSSSNYTKLRISGKKIYFKLPKKVNFKHYTSVKVFARPMSKEMWEKYPVHLDCKLYRDRRRKEKEAERIERKRSLDIEDKSSKEHLESLDLISHSEKEQNRHSIDKKVDTDDDKDKNSSSKLKDVSKANGNVEKIYNVDSDESVKIQSKKRNSKSGSKSDSSSDEKIEKSNSSVKKKKIRISEVYSSDSDEVDKTEKVDEKDTNKIRSSKSKKHRDSSSDSNSSKSKSRKSHEEVTKSNEDESEISASSKQRKDSKDINKSDNDSNTKKESEISIIELDSDDDVNENKNTSDQENRTSKQDSEGDKENAGEEQDGKSDTSKPLIKLVNINKLLKPEIVKETVSKESSSVLVVHMNKKGELKEKYADMRKEKKQEERKTKKRDSEEKFWAQKRLDVKLFKPKKFVISIGRFPSPFTENFLRKENLKCIIQNGKTVYRLLDDSELTSKLNEVQPLPEDSEVHELTSKLDKEDQPADNTLIRAKNALLNDSDTEKENSPSDSVQNESENVKKTLLHSSESDLNDGDKNETTGSKNTNLANTELDACEDKNVTENSGSGKNVPEPALEVENKDNPSPEKELPEPKAIDRDKAKSALLNDSSSSNSSKSGDKEKTSGKKSRRKHIMESMHAKKMLLTYSSSSDTEDEQLKSVLKNIKDSLLKDIVTDEEEAQESPTKLKNNSESEQDVDQAKKKRKLSETRSVTAGSDSDKVDSKEEKPQHESRNKSSDSEETRQGKERRDSQSRNQSSDLDTADKEEDSQKEATKTASESDEEVRRAKSGSDNEEHKARNKSSSSESENAREITKKRKASSSSSESENARKVKKKSKVSDSDNTKDGDQTDKEDSDNSSSVKSKATRKKMGRSKEKPDGSSSHSSDNLDDKDIEGLTNLKSLHKSRRLRGKMSSKAGGGGSSKKTSDTPHIKGEEGLLEAPSSSDNEASAGESDAIDEDLPPVSLPGLNGGGMLEHLAKDDLLGESESDSSKDKSSDTIKKESDSEADNVKAKRRKANAIASSDSEAGSSRLKKRDPKVSDFEDSEDESSEPNKKNKRKKKASDSDASSGSSNEGSTKKKRRRIKEVDSEASGSDTENEGRSKHGRKNIRKVMGKNQLEEATKKAARQERERLARIAERQKMYNNLAFDESGKPDEVILDKVILDFDPETKEPLIEVDRGLVKKLKPHQANGIKFMWDACFESVKRIKKDKGSGCILAHCMGLGKTLQVVSLTHTLLTHSELTKVNRVLVVCPLSTVLNWVNEFNIWLKHAERDYELDIYELSRYKQNAERAYQLSQWFRHGGVCVLGYEMFRNLSADNLKKYKKKILKQLQEALVDPGPDMVVCDEGHLLKNEKTSLSQSMNRVKTLRRIVLTGTPLQNNLKEYYCMVQFVKPNLLGKYNEYLNRFVNPITNGQYTDSTEHDIRIMKRRSHVLHKMLDGAVQRRDYGVLAPFLPPKHEYVLFITLTDVQIKLYQHYLDNYSRRPLPGKSSGFLFPDFQSLQRIWTHPLVLKYNSERYEIMQQKKREREEEDSEGSLVDFIDDDSTPDESSSDDESDSLSDLSDDSRKKSKKKKSKKGKKDKDKDSKPGPRRGTRSNPVELLEEVPDIEAIEHKNENPTEWWIPLVTDDEIEDLRNSHKLVLLFEILRQCEAIGDKLLVFSQSLYSLDLIEYFLGKIDEATQEARVDEKLNGHVGSWAPGVDYFRLDGSTSCENRSIWCKNFNREDNPRARLFLISTRAGGLGINLVAANRVVIFDVSWNPSHDVQSIFRVYRFGQKKPCYIYRFLCMGTMEEKIYERQVTKQAISKRVIDEQQIDRHYAENDLAELYKFEPKPPEPRPVPLVPKDRLFAEMLKEHAAMIYKFHEHDSLLENKEEETLSEEERKAAWDDFENEKNRPPPAPFPSWPMHNGMMPNMIAQQQQQLAYAAVAAMLRKDMPNISDDNIRAMLPLIYAANPAMFGGYDYGLMQKVQEMTYKYNPAAMMNPGMNMNPLMNAGGGGAGSVASGMSASGLAGYEPPWQRQQQQHMGLQQLLQAQNQMGAKLYAGGLGSRDPVAMALQQQRAREIMLGGAGRPRGRPPNMPRSMTSSSDVVNLDSD